jgi:hypothetical protein
MKNLIVIGILHSGNLIITLKNQLKIYKNE